MSLAKARGDRGEAEVARYLRRKGCALLASQWRCRFGEIDLIARDKKYLVFVEVKLRKSADFAQAMEYVDKRKQDRIRATASFYLSEHPTALQPRFDVMEIYAPEGTRTRCPEFHYMEDAFE